jgi:PAS domain S-box-containing protein
MIRPLDVVRQSRSAGASVIASREGPFVGFSAIGRPVPAVTGHGYAQGGSQNGCDAVDVHSGFDLSALGGAVADATDAVMVIGQDDRIRYANASVETVLGYVPNELIGELFTVLVPPSARNHHQAQRGDFIAAPRACEMNGGLAVRAVHADGHEVDVEVTLLPVVGSEPATVLFVRDVSDRERLLRRLAATTDLLTAALGGADLSEIESKVVDLTCSVTRADVTWLATTLDDGRSAGVVRSCGAGDGFDWLRDVLDDSGRVLGESATHVRVSRELLASGSADEAGERDATAILLPFRTIGRSGLMAIGRSAGHAPFDDVDEQVAVDFMSAAAITLGLVTARTEMDRLRALTDHERIARELHDTVIQRLFAIAMRLESVLPVSSGASADRIGEAVDSLDEVIRSIRTTIFNLRRPMSPGSGLRSAVAAEVDAVVGLLGFAPRLRFGGLVDSSIPEGLAAGATAVVRELLSNAVRHSGAGEVDVSVTIENGQLVIEVSDDGVGLPPGMVRGDGLSNLGRRASDLGGAFVIGASRQGGLQARWQVPLDAGATDSPDRP